MKSVYIAIVFGVILLVLSSYTSYRAIEEYKQCEEWLEKYKAYNNPLMDFIKVPVELGKIVSLLVAIIQVEFGLIGASIIALAWSIKKRSD